ncbi:MAG: DUF3048 domain-containing protein [Coriobacteriia bacterium]|nr:DUF3048 domain-containing protein [Coriobacteriia bacterium]
MTRRVLAASLVLALAAVGIAGCKRDVDVVASWPEAVSERAVAKPVEPPKWPLNGLEAPSEEAIVQRVVSVKIENSAEARPQTGLQSADVVYETVTEGGVTRFNALYHSQVPENVGPIRSARNSDTYIVPQYHALFVFSGASPEVSALIKSAGLENLSEDAGVSKPFTRSRKRSSPHNLYGDVPEFRAEAERRGMPTTLSITGLAFDRRPSAETTPTITQVTVPFSSANTVVWTYDPETRSYLRVNNGRVFTDEATGEQVRATNVVVMWVQYKAAARDVVGSTTYDITLVGSGRATVFRDGQRYDCTWEATADAPPVFKAEDGTQVRLAQGNTWMQVVDTDVNIAMQ